MGVGPSRGCSSNTTEFGRGRGDSGVRASGPRRESLLPPKGELPPVLPGVVGVSPLLVPRYKDPALNR